MIHLGASCDTYDGPAENHQAAAAIRRVGEQLADDRRLGLEFPVAWSRALAASPPSIRPALQWARPTWSAAYNRRQLPAGAVVASLRDSMPDEREALTTGRVNV